MKKVFFLSVAFFIVFFSCDLEAQMNRRSIKKNNRRISSYRGQKYRFSKDKAYSMIGISLNALNYYGDLAPRAGKLSTDLSFTRPAVSLLFARRLGPRFSLTTTFLYGTLRGADAESADEGDAGNGVFRFQRNLSFRNRIKELSVVANIDLAENMATYISRAKWTPYLYGGLSIFHHNPQAIAPAFTLGGQPLPEAGQWVDLQPLGTEGQYAELQDGDVNQGIKPYKKIQIAIPIGLGVRFRLNEVMDFSAEVGVRYLFTDYIDDVSRNYVDLGVFEGNELAKALSYRSNEVIAPDLAGPPTYVGRDGQDYWTIPGYGQEAKDNLRGDRDKDIFTVTSLKLTYILGKTFHRAKFR